MTIDLSQTPLTNDEDRWAAIVSRSPSADGQFYYSVSTTSVYCLPSCPSRLALRKNVRFHETCAEAERAGFRPCKRCRPDEPSLDQRNAKTVAMACRLIEAAERPLNLDEFAEACRMSKYHFHRVFKAITGVTPKTYGTEHRAKRVRDTLSHRDTVTEAIYDAGFNSNGRFYATTDQMLGMTPTRFRDGGANTKIRFAVGECTLGAILVAATEKGVCAISLGEEADPLVQELQDRFPRANLIGGDQDFEQLVAHVIGFVETPSHGLDLPLDIRGTVFQQRVWLALRQIPTGSTASYGEIAKHIGSPKAVRAVAKACASNAIAIAVPCHRVVRTDGSLSGYRWGVERKRALILREGRVTDATNSSVPSSATSSKADT